LISEVINVAVRPRPVGDNGPYHDGS
jgi:hypothetical protein